MQNGKSFIYFVVFIIIVTFVTLLFYVLFFNQSIFCPVTPLILLCFCFEENPKIHLEKMVFSKFSQGIINGS